MTSCRCIRLQREGLHCRTLPWLLKPAPRCWESWCTGSRGHRRRVFEQPTPLCSMHVRQGIDPRSAHVPTVCFTGQKQSTQESRITKLNVAGGLQADSPEWPEELSIYTGARTVALHWTWTIMHVLFWGLGLLLFPDLLNVAASTDRLVLNASAGTVSPFENPSFSYFPTLVLSLARVTNEWHMICRKSSLTDLRCTLCWF